MVEKCEERAPRQATWMEENFPEGLTVFGFPRTHQRRIRTANSLERLNREVRRRSRVAVLSPNVASCLRLVTAVLMEISEEWETGRTYMRLDVEDIPF
jgi:putative transposase